MTRGCRAALRLLSAWTSWGMIVSRSDLSLKLLCLLTAIRRLLLLSFTAELSTAAPSNWNEKGRKNRKRNEMQTFQKNAWGLWLEMGGKDKAKKTNINYGKHLVGAVEEHVIGSDQIHKDGWMWYDLEITGYTFQSVFTSEVEIFSGGGGCKYPCWMFWCLPLQQSGLCCCCPPLDVIVVESYN